MGPTTTKEASTVTFGPIVAADPELAFDVSVSDDKRAFTITFAGFVAALDGRGASSSEARLFSIPIPVDRGGGQAEIEFATTGFALTTQGGTATIVLSVNGHSVLADFGEDADDSFVKTVTVPAAPIDECRLFVLLLAGRDPTGDGAAHLNVNTIDAEILPRATTNKEA